MATLLTAEQIYQQYGVTAAQLRQFVEEGDLNAIVREGIEYYSQEDILELIRGGKVHGIRELPEGEEELAATETVFLDQPALEEKPDYLDLDESALMPQPGVNAPAPRLADSSQELGLVGGSSGELMMGSDPSLPGDATHALLEEPGSSTGDSGISLASDSGISLASDSGISLASDSGISLASDSGISLEQPTQEVARQSEPKSPTGLDETEFELSPPAAVEHTAPLPVTQDQTAFAGQAGGDDHDQTQLMFKMPDEERKPERSAAVDLEATNVFTPPGLSGMLEMGATVQELELADELDKAPASTEETTMQPGDEAESDFPEFSEFTEAAGEEEGFVEESLDEEVPVEAVRAPAPRREPGWGAFVVSTVTAGAVVMLLNLLLVWEGVRTMWSGDTLIEPLGSLVSSLGSML
ncbi:MAG: hypothetical protein KatS3mg113_0282 [Planctomycetaceae bacterium]|nr:MAG: hypothetical protein KatS3mg113_0282 [Planctomycetaceae bacterium]